MEGTDCDEVEASDCDEVEVADCDEVEAADCGIPTVGVTSCGKGWDCLLTCDWRTPGVECHQREDVRVLEGFWPAIGGVGHTLLSGGGDRESDSQRVLPEDKSR